ncbi:unnamed protein product [Caretta caretta]
MRAVLTLLPKKGDLRNLQNWCPISLLSTDYKVVVKAISLWLGSMLADVGHPDQTYTVPGCTIFDNLYLVQDLLELGYRDGLSFALLSLDQEKAFDRVDHGYLLSTLTRVTWRSHLFGSLLHAGQLVKSSGLVVGDGWQVSSLPPALQAIRWSAFLPPICLHRRTENEIQELLDKKRHLFTNQQFNLDCLPQAEALAQIQLQQNNIIGKEAQQLPDIEIRQKKKIVKKSCISHNKDLNKGALPSPRDTYKGSIGHNSSGGTMLTSWPLLYDYLAKLLILKTLLKLRQQGVRIILIASSCQLQAWYSDAHHLSVATTFHLQEDLLSQNSGALTHPNSLILNL